MQVLIATLDDGRRRVAPYHLDAGAGRLRRSGAGVAVDGCMALALSPGGETLYATGHGPGAEPGTEGVAAAYRVGDLESGGAQPLWRRATRGTTPCFASPTPDGRLLLVANFRGLGDRGSVVAIPTRDGDHAPPADRHEHTGRSIHPQRQRCSHPHAIGADPLGRFAYVPDLGVDRVFAYRLDTGAERLIPIADGGAAVEPGSGPRHLAFHPNGRWMYVVTEMGNRVIAFARDPDTGGLAEIGSVSTLPPGREGGAAADLRVNPAGTLLYASNRGHDSVAAFRIGPDGRLDPVGHAATPPDPRHLALTPDGGFLLAASGPAGLVAVFRCGDGGDLERTDTAAVPAAGAIVA